MTSPTKLSAAALLLPLLFVLTLTGSSSGQSPDASSKPAAAVEQSGPVNPTKSGQRPVRVEPQPQPDTDGIMASVFSGTGLLVTLGLVFVSLLVVRTVRSRSVNGETEPTDVGNPATTAVSKTATSANGAGDDRKATGRPSPTTKTSLFSAFRINQEVRRLVRGEEHREEVLWSRAIDDRRAIETALLKVATAAHCSEDERSRACSALERLGFVARHCATLLAATDSFERASAARLLGEIGSHSAAPFLLEALFDGEATVRNQAILSLSSLKDPSAIRVLVDIARRTPELPNTLVRQVATDSGLELNLDGLGGQWSVAAASFNRRNVFGINGLETPSPVIPLAESSDDKQWSEAFSNLSSAKAEERINGAKVLADFPCKRSVSSLIQMVGNDPEPTVRSIAVASLGCINHESVFPAVLLALSDESREVRAAAARAMTRLSFERADAYVRLLAGCNEESLRQLAGTCVKAGIVSQNLDRLASGDRRQAYETFALICILARADLTDVVLDTIATHVDMNVRLSAIHLLATTGEPVVLQQMRQLTEKKLPEDIKTALLEAIYKLEQVNSTEVSEADTVRI